MTGKVKLPQVVAEAIEKLRNAEYSNYGIVTEIDSGELPTSVNGVLTGRGIIRDWIYDNDGANADRLLEVLVNGYEVEPEYKVGDWVVWVTKYETLIIKIEHIQKRGPAAKKTFNKQEFHFECIERHATPEEIKAEHERRVWVGIGRKVGEFRDGDVRISKENVSTKTMVPDFATGEYFSGDLKGFFPAESFVSFEEVDSNA